MNTPAGLTCTRCRQHLYPAAAKATDNGWMHAQPCRRTCTVEDCTRKHHANGYCTEHNRRWKKYGDPAAIVVKVNNDERLEDVQWMAETGENLSGAAARLGMSVKALDIWLRRHDRQSMARLLANEPKDHNRIPGGVSIAELTGLNERRARQPYRQKRSRKVAA